MAMLGSTYSRLVTWLKILLPLTALAILSSLFLVSRTTTPALLRPATDNIDSEPLHEAQISLPSLSGVAQNGAAYSIGAKSAVPRPSDPNIVDVIEINGLIKGPDGLAISLSSKKGSINSAAGTATLSQNIKIETSDGYHIQTEELRADIQHLELQTIGSITGSGPMGQVSAGQMVLQQQSQDGSDPSYELVFKNGVTLLYLPRQ